MAVLVRDMLQGKTLRHRSEYVVADNVKLDWTPERPAVGIYIAARGGKTLEAAGEVADGAVIGALVSDTGLDYAFAAIERGAQRAGRSLNDLEVVSWVTCLVVDDRSAVEPRLRNSVAHIIGGAPETLLQAIGLERDYISTLKASYHEGGSAKAAQHVTWREIDMFSVVGNADQVSEVVARLARRGVNQVGILLTEPDMEGNLRVLERVARDVMPNFR
jgi:5,10-methylenetetrahydromethanopterin reductase